MTTIYVGNLPFTATPEDVQALFEPYGKVVSVNLINDRESGRPRGFGFVEMGEVEAAAAIAAVNGAEFGGRALRVNPAQDRGQRSRTGGGPYRR